MKLKSVLFKLARSATFLRQLNVMVALALICVLMAACAGRSVSPPNYQDVCSVFKYNPRWYQAAKKSTQYWGGNIQLPMAIIYQESTFRRDARPKRSKILGFIPGKRASNAYGYSQALTGTWGDYERAVGSRSKRRDNFADAFDFVQWYVNQSYKRNKVSKWDYDAHYLNYHEGQGGFSRGTHLTKQWLLNTAAKVEQRAKRYSTQLHGCKTELDAIKTGWF